MCPKDYNGEVLDWSAGLPWTISWFRWFFNTGRYATGMQVKQTWHVFTLKITIIYPLALAAITAKLSEWFTMQKYDRGLTERPKRPCKIKKSVVYHNIPPEITWLRKSLFFYFILNNFNYIRFVYFQFIYPLLLTIESRIMCCKGFAVSRIFNCYRIYFQFADRLKTNAETTNNY